jgi:hypothetical protein
LIPQSKERASGARLRADLINQWLPAIGGDDVVAVTAIDDGGAAAVTGATTLTGAEVAVTVEVEVSSSSSESSPIVTSRDIYMIWHDIHHHNEMVSQSPWQRRSVIVHTNCMGMTMASGTTNNAFTF